MRVELKNIGNQGPEHFQQSGTADHLWQWRAYKKGFAPMRKKKKASVKVNSWYVSILGDRLINEILTS